MSHLYLEVLEDRIAPAGLFSYTDVDGDTVKITSSKGNNSDLAVAIQPYLVNSGLGFQLQQIDLTSVVFQDSKLVITAKKTALGGNGFADVGYVDANGVDLKSIMIDGDLGRIEAGDADSSTNSIDRLKVNSLGAAGLTTQALGGNLTSDLFGSVHSFKVTQNIDGAHLFVWGNSEAEGGIKILRIGGSLLGADGVDRSGLIWTTGDLGNVYIGGDIIGAESNWNAGIYTQNNIHSISIKGSIIGGNHSTSGASGQVQSVGNIDRAWIGGDIVGGGFAFGGSGSGYLSAGQHLGNFYLQGNLIGGNGGQTGMVYADSAKTLIFRNDIQGGNGTESGGVIVGQTLQNITVYGSVIGGQGHSSGLVNGWVIDHALVKKNVVGGLGFSSGRVDAADAIEHVSIQGTLVGGDGEWSGSILSGNRIDKVAISKGIIGGDGVNSGNIHAINSLAIVHIIKNGLTAGSGNNSAQISSDLDINKVRITGNITAGTGIDAGQIFAGRNIADIFIHGSLVGVAGMDDVGIFYGNTLGSLRITGSFQGSEIQTS